MARVISNSGSRKLTLRPVSPGLLDLDQVAEAKRLELGAIFHEDVEIGVGDGRLVFVFGLERHRLDVVLAVRLGFEGWLLLRIDELDPDLAMTRDLILFQEIAKARHQRRQQGMGLRAEIAADQERLLHLAQIGLRLASRSNRRCLRSGRRAPR